MEMEWLVYNYSKNLKFIEQQCNYYIHKSKAMPTKEKEKNLQ